MTHILPINDTHPHLEISACPCKPRIILKGLEQICIHNSYDGREHKEPNHDKQNCEVCKQTIGYN